MEADNAVDDPTCQSLSSAASQQILSSWAASVASI